MLIGGAERFRICQASTRHEKLESMTGAAFHQVSRTVAEQMARAQFAEKTAATNADEAAHLQDFAELWDGLETRWLASLDDSEREKFAQLATDAHRGAFRIIRSYARKAAQDGAPDFPIAVENLGERLGITMRGAGLLRAKFARLGTIERTAPHRANVAAARYRWTADIGQPF